MSKQENIDLDQLFHQARTHNGWLDQQISTEQIHKIYDLVKMGPTSANCCPARFVFLTTAESKAQLKPALSTGNIEKTMSAPLTVLVATDQKFYDQFGKLFPHADAKSWFTSSPELALETAFRNSSMQAAYLILACRSLGLDTGPMSGFNPQKVNDIFFKNTDYQINMIINIGYGDHTKIYSRLPRLDFFEACKIL